MKNFGTDLEAHGGSTSGGCSTSEENKSESSSTNRSKSSASYKNMVKLTEKLLKLQKCSIGLILLLILGLVGFILALLIMINHRSSRNDNGTLAIQSSTSKNLDPNEESHKHPSSFLSMEPSNVLYMHSSKFPTQVASNTPSILPSALYSSIPSSSPSLVFSTIPSLLPSEAPTYAERSVAPTPLPTKKCQGWCKNHVASWSDKCEWELNCAGCIECQNSYVASAELTQISNEPTQNSQPLIQSSLAISTQITETTMQTPQTTMKENRGVCMDWCATNAAPWRDPDPDVRQKCDYPTACGGCPECFVVVASTPNPTQLLTASPTRIPTPSPTKGCKSWCATHPASWNDQNDPVTYRKCNWQKNCAGCAPCLV